MGMEPARGTSCQAWSIYTVKYSHGLVMLGLVVGTMVTSRSLFPGTFRSFDHGAVLDESLISIILRKRSWKSP